MPPEDMSNLKNQFPFPRKIRIQEGFRGVKKKLPIKSDEESSLVDKRFEISNLDLIKDIVRIINLVNA